MIREVSILRVLALSILVLALMTTTASSAQAAPSWLVLTGSGTVVEEGTVSLQTETETIIHTKIAGVAVLFLCPTIAAENFLLKAAGTIGAGAKIKWSGCLTDVNGSHNAACEPNDPVGGPGTIVTKPLHGVLVLHELSGGAKDELLLLLPDSGNIFATIFMGGECVLGTKINIIGTHFMIKDCENTLLTHREVHLLEEGPLTKLWAISETAEHVLSILGSWFARVTQGGSFRSYAGHAG